MLIPATLRAYVCATPVDMRKSIDGLALLVQPLFELDALSGHLFVFLSRGRDKVKVLYWDRHGFALWYKRLERGRFALPGELAQRGLCAAELMLWLEGIDLQRTRRLRSVEVRRVG